MKSHFWVLLGELIDNGRDNSGGNWLRCSYPNVSHCRVGNEIDVFNTAAYFIEHRGAALNERQSVRSRFDTSPAPVKQAHSECVLQIRDRLRYCGLRHMQPNRSASHSAGLHNGHQDIEVA